MKRESAVAQGEHAPENKEHNRKLKLRMMYLFWRSWSCSPFFYHYEDKATPAATEAFSTQQALRITSRVNHVYCCLLQTGESSSPCEVNVCVVMNQNKQGVGVLLHFLHEGLHPGVNVRVQTHHVLFRFLARCGNVLVSQIHEHPWAESTKTRESQVTAERT